MRIDRQSRRIEYKTPVRYSLPGMRRPLRADDQATHQLAVQERFAASRRQAMRGVDANWREDVGDLRGIIQDQADGLSRRAELLIPRYRTGR